MGDPLSKVQAESCRAVALRDKLLCSVETKGSDNKWTSPSRFDVAWTAEGRASSTPQTGCTASAEAADFVEQVNKLWLRAKKHLDGPSQDSERAADAVREAWSLATATGRSACRHRLGECHSLRLQLARDGLDAAIACGRWDEALDYARAVASISWAVYPKAWPVTALALTRQAKLELYHANFCAAITAGEAALQIFSICAADSLEVAQELRQIVAEARAEAVAAGEALPTLVPPPVQARSQVQEIDVGKPMLGLGGYSTAAAVKHLPAQIEKPANFDLEGLD